MKHKSAVPGYGPWSQKAGIVHVQPPVEVLQRMISLRLHLDDADDANGALFVLPGSHCLGILNSARIDELKRKTAAQVCNVKKGSAMLMRPLLVHASSVASNPTHRRVLHFEYATGELNGGLEWDSI